ncbi:hypothetical protein WICPIJ_008709 [Wickerhamomyces pijperi]|uniref:Uncharacterized protein n=1 Tax=Wickerhamomyces pijperi TaxID=599730 RepID=A0A9P8TI12_WICPI|nr:hypothetical protein WICPIJ_008709 [Wickerhamomyces pijperi]
MLVERNSNVLKNGINQGFNQIRESSDENTPSPGSNHAQYAASELHNASSKTSPRQVIPGLTARQSHNVIPTLKQEKGSQSQDSALKYSVVQMLKNDSNRTNFDVLKEFNNHSSAKNSSQSASSFTTKPRLGYRANIPTSPITSRSVFSPTSSTLHNYYHEEEEEEEEEEGEAHDDISFDHDLQLDATLTRKIEEDDMNDATELFDLYKKNTSFELENIIEHPAFSVLNPQVKYVTVAPPRLGKPLLPNGEPLDLSCVDMSYTDYPPLNHEDKENLSNDELKLYSILDYELKQVGGSLNWSGSKNVAGDNSSGVDSDEETDLHGRSKTSYFSDICNSFFVKHFNKDAHYESKYPWYKITNDIDNAKDTKNPHVTDTKAGGLYDGPQFERNNTDMFPVSNKFFTTSLIKTNPPIDHMAPEEV